MWYGCVLRFGGFLSGFPRFFASSVRSCRGFCSWIRFSCLLGPSGWILPEILKSCRVSCWSRALYSEIYKKTEGPPVALAPGRFFFIGGYGSSFSRSLSLDLLLKNERKFFRSPWWICRGSAAGLSVKNGRKSAGKNKRVSRFATPFRWFIECGCNSRLSSARARVL